MADTTTGGENVATPDALEQVAALGRRVARTEAQTEEATRRATAATEAAAHATDAAARAIQTAEATTTTNTRAADLDRLNGEMNTLQKQYEEAFTAGDGAAAGAAQAKMARLGGRLARLEDTADDPPAPTRRPATDGGRVTGPSPDKINRVNALIAARWVGATAEERELFLAGSQDLGMAGRTPKSAAWLRQHPEYFEDRRFNAMVRAADTEWEAEGKERDTDEYFDFIERKTGLATDPTPALTDDPPRRVAATKPGADLGTDGAAVELTPAGADAAPGRRTPPQPGRPHRAPVAAPPTRDGAPALSGRGGDRGQIRISPEMQEAAKWMYPGGIDPAEYAEEHRRLVEDGEIVDRFGRR